MGKSVILRKPKVPDSKNPSSSTGLEVKTNSKQRLTTEKDKHSVESKSSTGERLLQLLKSPSAVSAPAPPSDYEMEKKTLYFVQELTVNGIFLPEIVSHENFQAELLLGCDSHEERVAYLDEEETSKVSLDRKRNEYFYNLTKSREKAGETGKERERERERQKKSSRTLGMRVISAWILRVSMLTTV